MSIATQVEAKLGATDGDEPLSRGSCTIKLSLSLSSGGRSEGGAPAAGAGAVGGGGGGLRAPGGDGTFCCGGPWPSMLESGPEPSPNSAKRNARATSDTLSERLVV